MTSPILDPDSPLATPNPLLYRVLSVAGRTGDVVLNPADIGMGILIPTPSAGTGTEGSPYTDPDNTAGIQTEINALAAARGGKVNLLPKRYNIATPITISTAAIQIEGEAPGFNIDPNGETEGILGTKLKATTTAFVLGDGSSTERRIGHVALRDLYLFGSSRAGGFFDDTHIGLKVIGPLDQPRFHNLNISGFNHAVKVARFATAYERASLDGPHFNNINILNCAYGFCIEVSPDWFTVFANITDCVVADTDYQGLLVVPHNPDKAFDGRVVATRFIRCARKANDANDAAIVIVANRWTIEACTVFDSGHDFVGTGAGTGVPGYQGSADGIILMGNDNLVVGCQIMSNTVGAGVRVKSGSRNIIRNNKFGALAPWGANQTDIIIEAAATDTIIDQDSGVTIVDNGVRTIINGWSKNEGDPDLVGQWFGVAKPEGLRIYDTVNKLAFTYSASIVNGRSQSNISVIATASNQVVRAEGNVINGAAGNGSEMGFDAVNNWGYMIAVNRTTNALRTLVLNGTDLRLFTNDTEKARMLSSGGVNIGGTADPGAGNLEVTSRIKTDGSVTAGHTRFFLYDVDNGAMERVTVGAADSGGAGFKVLRIPN